MRSPVVFDEPRICSYPDYVRRLRTVGYLLCGAPRIGPGIDLLFFEINPIQVNEVKSGCGCRDWNRHYIPEGLIVFYLGGSDVAVATWPKKCGYLC